MGDEGRGDKKKYGGSMEIEERKINIQTNKGMFELIKGKLVDDERRPRREIEANEK